MKTSPCAVTVAVSAQLESTAAGIPWSDGSTEEQSGTLCIASKGSHESILEGKGPTGMTKERPDVGEDMVGYCKEPPQELPLRRTTVPLSDRTSHRLPKRENQVFMPPSMVSRISVSSVSSACCNSVTRPLPYNVAKASNINVCPGGVTRAPPVTYLLTIALVEMEAVPVVGSRDRVRSKAIGSFMVAFR